MDVSKHFSFISLKTLWEKQGKPSKAGVKRMLHNFECRNDDVQHFIRELAVNSELNPSLNTKTYFIMDKKLTKIFLYFTLKTKSISLIGVKRETLSILINDSRKTSVIAVLLAQLGKNKKYEDKLINTILIWDSIYEKINQNETTPEIIIVDCKKELKKYYEKLGFIQIDNDNINNLFTLAEKFTYTI